MATGVAKDALISLRPRSRLKTLLMRLPCRIGRSTTGMHPAIVFHNDSPPWRLRIMNTAPNRPTEKGSLPWDQPGVLPQAFFRLRGILVRPAWRPPSCIPGPSRLPATRTTRMPELSELRRTRSSSDLYSRGRRRSTALRAPRVRTCLGVRRINHDPAFSTDGKTSWHMRKAALRGPGPWPT